VRDKEQQREASMENAKKITNIYAKKEENEGKRAHEE
jgi:hypothetical protein